MQGLRGWSVGSLPQGAQDQRADISALSRVSAMGCKWGGVQEEEPKGEQAREQYIAGPVQEQGPVGNRADYHHCLSGAMNEMSGICAEQKDCLRVHSAAEAQPAPVSPQNSANPVASRLRYGARPRTGSRLPIGPRVGASSY